MATYTSANAIKKISTGDESGTWGDSTNNNFDIIDRAANGFVSIALSSTSYTLSLSTTAVLSDGHYKAINFTGTPGGTCTVTLEQNNKARLYMIVNSTNQSLSITQGSGANVTIAATKSAIVLADGAGSGAAVTDFTAVLSALTELDVTAGTVSASKAVVVDSDKDITGFRNVTMTGELDAATLDISGDADIDGTTNLDIVDIDGAVNIAAATTIATDNKIQFRDTAIYIQSSADGQLDIVADTEVQIAATTIDINGAVALNGAITGATNIALSGAITGATNITLSGELDAATLDISGDADIDGTLETDALSLNGTAVTSTAAELNQLDAITRGSIIYGNASGATARLAKGGANTVLTSDGTDISWAAAVIGVGQSWRADTERTANTFFQNNSPSAIMVQAYTTSGPIMDVGPATDNTVPIAQSDRDGDLDNPMYVIVPAYHYWRVSGVDHVDNSNRQNILD